MKAIFVGMMGLCCCVAGFALNSEVPESADAVKPLQKGDAAPDVILKTVDGKDFNLKRELKKQPTVLIFYRGGWCPYCNLHLSALQKIDPQLRQLGYRIIAVSPDKPEKLRESLTKDHLTYTLLSDHSMKAAREFGIAFKVDDATLQKYKTYGINLEVASGEKHHLLPVPAVFLVGQDGLIKFSYVNSDYKKRIGSEALLDAAKK